MPEVPHWIGQVGLVLGLLLCGAFLGGALWLAVLLMIPCFALVLIESRYEQGLMGTRRG
jgi:membrane-bound ClpP family serine protease